MLLLPFEPFLNSGEVSISCRASLLTYDFQLVLGCLLYLFVLLLDFFHLISQLLVVLSCLRAFSLHLGLLVIRSEDPVLVKFTLELFLFLLLLLLVVVEHILKTLDSLLCYL